MEAIQALPLGTALAVGGPAVAVGGLSLWFLNSYVADHKRKSSSNLPPLPGIHSHTHTHFCMYFFFFPCFGYKKFRTTEGRYRSMSRVSKRAYSDTYYYMSVVDHLHFSYFDLLFCDMCVCGLMGIWEICLECRGTRVAINWESVATEREETPQNIYQMG